MIRLMHVISDSNVGGAGRYLLTYLRNCNRSEFEVSVTLPKGSKLANPIRDMGIVVHEINGLAERSISMSGLLALARLFRREKPQLLHTHACLSARIAGRLTGVKRIVYTRHSVFPQKDVLTKGPGKVLNKMAGLLLSDAIIAVAEAAKKNLTDTGIPEDRIEVIYNGVDAVEQLDDQQQQQVRSRFHIAEDEFVVAIIARLERVKGHEYFIDAAADVKAAGIKTKFVIAGTGERMDALKAYATEKQVDDVVLFTGFLTDVGQLENIMDVQVNASFGTEAASLSLLEGMSLGKPAVVSDYGGNPELIVTDVNGIVVPKCNSGALSDAVIGLLRDDEKRSFLGQQARRMFSQRFTAQLMTEQMELFYKKVL